MKQEELDAILTYTPPETRQSFSGQNLDGLDLRDRDLRGADMDYVSLVKANLDRANLKGATFYRGNLTGASLRGANLECVNFGASKIKGADFTDANLSRAKFGAVDSSDVTLTGATIDDIYLSPDVTWTAVIGAKGVVTREQCIANLDEIRKHVVGHGDFLDMGDWHVGDWDPSQTVSHACDTAHCLAGWAQALCPDEEIRNMDPFMAGVRLIPLAVHKFYESNAHVMAWLTNREYAKEAADAPA